MATESQVEVWDKCQPRQILSPNTHLEESIGLFRILHCGQQFLCLTMDTIYQLLIGIGYPVTLQDRFSQPAHHTSLDGTKLEAVFSPQKVQQNLF